MPKPETSNLNPPVTDANADLQAQLNAMRAENEALKASAKSGLRLQVSEKGGLSLYGVRRQFPVTFYREEWVTILDMADDIRQALEVHRVEMDRLSAIAKAKKIAERALKSNGTSALAD